LQPGAHDLRLDLRLVLVGQRAAPHGLAPFLRGKLLGEFGLAPASLGLLAFAALALRALARHALPLQTSALRLLAGSLPPLLALLLALLALGLLARRHLGRLAFSLLLGRNALLLCQPQLLGLPLGLCLQQRRVFFGQRLLKHRLGLKF